MEDNVRFKKVSLQGSQLQRIALQLLNRAIRVRKRRLQQAVYIPRHAHFKNV